MADELDELNQPSETEKRIKSLSGKVKEEAEAKDVALREKAEAEAKTAEANRERDFYASFSDMVADNPAAKEHKEEILAKVKAGYTTEDATFAVLGKAGKLGQPKSVEVAPVAGGSANTMLSSSGAQKPVADMSQEERRAALSDAIILS